MEIRPLQDRVIIKRIEGAKQTESGIFLADIAVAEPETGIIVAVGHGKVNSNSILIPMNVAVDDVVLFGKNGGQLFKYNGVEYLTMREDDIIGVITDK